MTETLSIKEQVKEEMQDFFKEDNPILRNVIKDNIEDVALGKAMEEGKTGEYVDEKELYDILLN